MPSQTPAPFTYTNRFGRTYVLNEDTTARGFPLYYFTQVPDKPKPVSELPYGYDVMETKSGLPLLRKMDKMR